MWTEKHTEENTPEMDSVKKLFYSHFVFSSAQYLKEKNAPSCTIEYVVCRLDV